jgi:hypothetical protein
MHPNALSPVVLLCPRRGSTWLRPALVLVAVLCGCQHIGPGTVRLDRTAYSVAIADSWKQQTLLNIVKLRYMDLPVFLDVSSIVAGYSLETSGSVTAELFPHFDGAANRNNLSLGARGVFIDRPTITYVPLTGEKFLRGLITPIDPKNIFFMLQAGYPADFILALTVESLNGVQNRSAAGAVMREADPDFIRALGLLRDVQAAGAIGMRVEEDKAKGSTGVFFFRRDDVAADILEKMAEVRRLLKLPPDLQRLVLTYSPLRGAEGELAVNSRSMLQIMGAFASYLDVPEAHRKDGSTMLISEDVASEKQRNIVRIHSGKDKPAGAYVAVPYREHWFWIDDSDWSTKRALTAVMFFFTLAETGSNTNLPLITIPAQ